MESRTIQAGVANKMTHTRAKKRGGKSLGALRFVFLAAALVGFLGAAWGETRGIASEWSEGNGAGWGLEDSLPTGAPQQTDTSRPAPDAPGVQAHGSDAGSEDGYGKQPKRILGIIPNFRAVSANTHLAPLSFKSEFWLATQDTFDYSDVVFVGALAGISMAGKSQPSFRQGAAGYGRYYWHSFVDGSIENYMTEAIVPAATREDPRYYTMGHGGFVKRTGYAVSRLFITRTNTGNSTFNVAEIVGAGAAAGIGNL